MKRHRRWPGRNLSSPKIWVRRIIEAGAGRCPRVHPTLRFTDEEAKLPGGSDFPEFTQLVSQGEEEALDHRSPLDFAG